MDIVLCSLHCDWPKPCGSRSIRLAYSSLICKMIAILLTRDRSLCFLILARQRQHWGQVLLSGYARHYCGLEPTAGYKTTPSAFAKKMSIFGGDLMSFFSGLSATTATAHFS
jgi:hypothetical protein